MENESKDLEQVKSFDIFDTVITRKYFVPKDLFYYLGLNLKEIGLITDPEKFLNARVEAEERARHNSNKEEITLNEIYDNFSSDLGLKSKLTFVKELELKYEQESFRIIKENLKKIDEKSIFISDTYLPRELLLSEFNNHKISYSNVYLSSDNRLTKVSGNLYELVVKNLGLAPNKISHLGDNFKSDYLSARSKGISATHYVNSLPNRYEKTVYLKGPNKMISKTIAGAMKSSRLECPYDGEIKKIIWETGSNVIGPFLFGYVKWILERCKELGLLKLYFISRDGQILYKIAKEIDTAYNLGIDLHYIYGSRKALHLPGTTTFDEFTLDWIFDSTFCSLNSVCKRTGLQTEDFADAINDMELNDYDRNLTILERKELANSMASSTYIQNKIKETAQQARAIIVDYFLQEGFTIDGKMGIVDLGWRGRLQSSISKILIDGKIYPKEGIVGFYVGLSNPIKPQELDRYETFFDSEELIRYSNSSLFEIFTSADHGTCVGYKQVKGMIDPILSENNELKTWGVEIQQESIINFTRTLLDMPLNVFNFPIADFKKTTRTILFKFIVSPELKEIQVYGESINFYDDQEEEKPIKMVSDISFKKVLMLPFVKKMGIIYGLWPEASLHKKFKSKIKWYLVILRFRRFNSLMYFKIQKL